MERDYTPKDFINWYCVSEYLTNNPDYLRKGWLDTPSKIPKKYRRALMNLASYIDAWLIEAEDLKNEGKK